MLLLFYILLSFIYSLDNSFDNQSQILVKVKDRIITKNDFIKRSEYAIRPSYCKSDNNIHKKIILNSLISEKIMAIDIEDNLLSSDYSNNFIDGFKEQKMREFLLREEVYNLIQIDSLTIQSHYDNSMKEYNIEFISLDNDSLSQSIEELLSEGVDFSNICYNYLNLKTIPRRYINYFDEHDPDIHNAIFSENKYKNQVIGPILSKDKKYIYIKIIDWTDNTLITNEDKYNQWDSVKRKIYENKCIKGYDLYVLNVMNGIGLEFLKEPFWKLVDQTFNQLSQEKNNEFNYERVSAEFNLLIESDIDPDEDLLVFNNKLYTISDIQLLINQHPLVFRKENIGIQDYGLQLKYAIADLLRDQRLNAIAYNREYDINPSILKEVQIFKDAILSNFHLKTYLNGKNISLDNFNSNYLNIIDNNLNDYIESLISKYSSDIFINLNLLDEIQLTRIDLYTYRKGVPYPFIVPNFPVLTSKYKIDYGIDVNIP